jgi:hypothetical protein
MAEASYHCGHTGCRCMHGKGQGEFCGDYCRQAAQQPATEARCACGHPDCQSQVHSPPEQQSDG